MGKELSQILIMGNTSSSCTGDDTKKVVAVSFPGTDGADKGYKWYGFHVLSSMCSSPSITSTDVKEFYYEKVLNIPFIVCIVIVSLMMLYFGYKMMSKRQVRFE